MLNVSLFFFELREVFFVLHELLHGLIGISLNLIKFLLQFFKILKVCVVSLVLEKGLRYEFLIPFLQLVSLLPSLCDLLVQVVNFVTLHILVSLVPLQLLLLQLEIFTLLQQCLMIVLLPRENLIVHFCLRLKRAQSLFGFKKLKLSRRFRLNQRTLVPSLNSYMPHFLNLVLNLLDTLRLRQYLVFHDLELLLLVVSQPLLIDTIQIGRPLRRIHGLVLVWIAPKGPSLKSGHE